MKKIILATAFILTTTAAHAQTALTPATKSMKCPPGYALDVGQPTPRPAGDPVNPNQKPKTALEIQQEDQQAMNDQFARFKCVPMPTNPQQ